MAERRSSSTNTSEGTMVTVLTDAYGSKIYLWSMNGCDDRTLPTPPPPPSRNPMSPFHQSFESRVTSFEAWPIQMAQTAEDMAHAGFVYTQSTDSVFCFHCGVRVRRWATHDDPWLEHLKRSPHCPYLKLTGVVKHKNVAAICVRIRSTRSLRIRATRMV
ncbi:death-associated inhibitor of apoptosis 2-like [Haliotis cracherodii]|uniref:death-associated inhibitor of apoptosis 2-like n=1 Tax=Haliotis cracherodii TaxID=6455 RepID=UPI0039EAAA32